MREIKFRAMRIDDGRWAYGYFFKTPITTEFNCDGQFLDSGGHGRFCIEQNGCAHEINIKTLGEYTGLKDKNGKEIYEGDIVKDYYSVPAVVVWIETGMWGVKYSRRAKTWCDMNVVNKLSLWTVIGNIYENPELIKK